MKVGRKSEISENYEGKLNVLITLANNSPLLAGQVAAKVDSYPQKVKYYLDELIKDGVVVSFKLNGQIFYTCHNFNKVDLENVVPLLESLYRNMKLEFMGDLTEARLKKSLTNSLSWFIRMLTPGI